MNNIYRSFAHVYDQFMQDAPYDEWISFTKTIIANEQLPVQSIVDLGCGTGDISIGLAKSNYDVTGIDISTNMLTIAQQKAAEQGVAVVFIQQNITQLEGFQQTDLFISFCDTMNYMQTTSEVKAVLQRVYDSLKMNGAFIFDVHSIHHVDHVLSDQTYADVLEDVAYIWFCDALEQSGAMQHDITFFKQNGKMYERFHENHIEVTYPVEQYKLWLEEIGFRNIKFFADFNADKEVFSNKTERNFIFAQK